MNETPNREFALVLRAEVNGWWFSPDHRLRAALKVLLRRYGFRCLECRPYVVAGPSQSVSKQVTQLPFEPLGLNFPDKYTTPVLD